MARSGCLIVEDEIRPLFFSFGETRTFRRWPGGGGGESEKKCFHSAVKITKKNDKAIKKVETKT